MAAADAAPRVDPRVRNLRKRLAQIDALEERQLLGEELTPEQHAKVGRRSEVEEELQSLLEDVEAAAQQQEEAESPTAVGSVAASAPPPLASPTMAARSTPLHMPMRSPMLRAQLADFEDLDAHMLDDVPGAVHGSPFPFSAPALRRQHSGPWRDDPVAVEDVAPAPPDDTPTPRAPEILEAVQPFAPATRECPRMRRLIRAVSELSTDAFESDVLDGVSKKGKWKLTLLAMPDDPAAEEDAWGGLLGFIAYKVKPAVHTVSIAKIAVVPEQRGHGHGHKLVQWLIEVSKRQKDIVYISLSSLPAAIRFYKHLGFKEVNVDLAKLDPASTEEGEEFIEGQVYMEYRCRRHPPKKKK